MTGIYGNNPEDRHFENELIEWELEWTKGDDPCPACGHNLEMCDDGTVFCPNCGWEEDVDDV